MDTERLGRPVPADVGAVEAGLCGLAIAFGIYLRVFRFWKPGLSLDEISTAYIASSPSLLTLWQRCRLAYEFPVHHFLTRFFLLFGHSELLVRLPSVILGIASIFLLFRLMKRYTGFRGALYACAIFALNSRFILYSQDGRMYALAVCLSLASVYSFLRILEDAKGGWLAAYFAVAILLSYNQVLYVTVFAGQISVAAVFYWRAPAEGRPRLRPLLLVQAAAVPLLILPAARMSFLFSARANLSSWMQRPDWNWIRYVLAWPEVTFASVLLPGAWDLWTNRRRLQPGSNSERALVWLAFLYAAIWPAALVLARLGVVNIMVSRYLLPALLGIVLLTGFCMSRVSGVLLRATFGAYLMLLIYSEGTGMYAFGNWLEETYKQDWRGASSWVESHYRPHDVVLVRACLNQSRVWPPDEPGSQQFLTAALTGFYTRTSMTALSLPYAAEELDGSPYAAEALEAVLHATRIVVLVNPIPEGWNWQLFEDWLQRRDPVLQPIERRSFGSLELRDYSREIPHR